MKSHYKKIGFWWQTFSHGHKYHDQRYYFVTVAVKLWLYVLMKKKNIFSHGDFTNRHQKHWWEGILVTDLFETVTNCKFRVGNFGANNFSHDNFIICDKKYNKWCFSYGFLWNHHYIYILWLLVTPLINRDYIYGNL